MNGEENGDLPEGWASTALDETGEWATGGTPSRKMPSYFGGTIPWIKSGDLNDGYVTRTDESITFEGLNHSAAKLLPVGTLSVALYGATIGKLGILTIDAATNQACANCIIDTRLSSARFLFFYLLSQRRALIEAGQGGAQPNLSNALVRDWVIPLPPLAEQRRIVAAVEALLARMNAARDRLNRVPAILKRFRQSVLSAACSGRLTADWRVTETDCPDDDELPAGWSIRPLSELCTRFEYGSSQKSQKSGRVPVLRMGNLQDGRIEWYDLVYTDDPKEIAKYRLSPNTVLFNRTNSPELVGKTSLFRGEREAVFAGYLIRVLTGSELDPHFLNYCLNAPSFKEFCLHVRTDGVSQSNINAQKLASYELNWCPVPEQQEIVRRVDALFALADRIEAKLDAARQRVESLTQSILAKAFRGELVPTEAELARRENRSYEPAADLLVRIRAERERAAAQGKPARSKRRSNDLSR